MGKLKAVKVWDKHTRIEYPWMFDIADHDTLMDWYNEVRVPRCSVEFRDAMNCSEVGGRGGHARDGAHIAFLSKIRGTDIVSTLAKLNDDTLNGMLNALRESGRIFVNRHGGYLVASRDIEIEKTEEIKNWILPGASIKVLRWPNGTHWYAKLGDTDITENGKEKWDTKDEAYRAAERFKRQHECTD